MAVAAFIDGQRGQKKKKGKKRDYRAFSYMISTMEKNFLKQLLFSKQAFFSSLCKVFQREVLAYSDLSSVPPRLFLPESGNTYFLSPSSVSMAFSWQY